MILITGTELNISELPNSDMIEYQIENLKMHIKLKTVAKSPTCFQIYISEDKRTEYTITDELSSKIIYFKDDKTLIKMLEEGEKSSETDIFDATPISPILVEVPEFEPPNPVVELDKPLVEVPIVKKDTKTKSKNSELSDIVPIEPNDSLIPLVLLEDADTELPESFLMIPNFGDDVDSLRVQIETKEKLISQKEGMIKELQNNIEQAYKVQEIQLNEIQELFDKQMSDAQNIINNLESKVSTGSLDAEASNFLKFINYAQNIKGVVKEGFEDKELSQLGHLNSKYSIFACGSGDSSYSMLKQVRKYIECSNDSVILDFSNDNFLASSFKLNSKLNHTMGLLKDDLNPVTLLKDINGSKFIPTTSFNDIALLNIDWVKLIRKIDDMASGKNVILIFGNINNFNIRFTVSKLATISRLFIFAKCSPIILSALYSDVQFIPKNRLTLVAVDYIDVVKSILGELSKTFNVLAFANEVEWGKLEV